MLPHLGAGAGQGIEDAYLLGKLLGNPQTDLSNVEVRHICVCPCIQNLTAVVAMRRRWCCSQAVLRAYATVRQPRAQRVWEGSRRAGDIYDSRAEYEGIRQEELQAVWNYVWNHPLDADYDGAVEALVAQGVFQSPSTGL